MLNAKAILIGVVVFIALYVPFSINHFTSNMSGLAGYLLLSIFVLPGFVAGYFASTHGVINGAAVGVAVGVLAVVVFLYPFDQETEGAASAATLLGSSLVFFSSLGGLLWQLIHGFSKKSP